MSDLSGRIADLPPGKLDLLLKRLVQEKAHQPVRRIVPIERSGNCFPLSLAQKRLWFIEQLTPGTALYNIPIATRLYGALDATVLAQALHTICQRHEALRTTFAVEEGEPVQIVRDSVASEGLLTVVELAYLPPTEREAAARQRALEEARRPFDISKDLLLRAMLLPLAPEEQILLITTHHLVSDGWSLGILLRELLTLTSGGKLPQLPVQYVDFAYWQQQQLPGEALERQRTYWTERLAGELPILDLATDHPRPKAQTYQGAQVAFSLSPALTHRLRQFSRQESVTHFMVMLAAYKALLHRYTGQTDLLVGSPIANRTRPELEGLIGLFVNTLVMRTDLAGDPSFRELVQRVRATALAAYDHADVPFEKLVELLQPARDLSRPPLFQTLFVHMEAPLSHGARGDGLAAIPLTEIHNGSAQFDLSLYAIEEEALVTGYLEYNSDLFERGSIERLGEHYRTLLAGAIASPELPLSRLPLLTAAEREQLVVDWNQTARPYPSQPLHRLLEDRAAQTPQRIAVTFLDGKLRTDSLTYEALNRRANQLAHELRRRGVGPDVLVGICLERSLAMVVALLAVLKAGGAYLPLDPAYPPARLALMLDDSAAPFLLSQEKLLDGLPPSQAELLCLDRDWAVVAEQPATDLPWEGTLAQLAYVIYTSGSTGQPKGVAVTQRGVVNFLTAMQQEPGLAQHDVLLAVTTLSFDIAVLELFLPLLTGAHLVVAAEEVAADGYKLQQALAQQNISLMQATPATWQMLLAAGWPGQAGLKMLCGGEALPASLARQLQPRGASLWNMYGPTETTVWSTVCPVEEGEGPVPIGRPIGNTHCYVLDPQRQPVPIGVPGELYIGGDGLARGYLNRPLLTAERFVPDPFRDGPGARLYRTGDLVCFRADGTLHFLNRIDHQVKVRGHRIELGEIETVLEQHPAVRQAVVIVREDAPGDRRLVAYLLAEAGEETPTVSGLRRFLRRFLPDYMVISTAVFLQQFPLTANGKVNRRALPQPQTTRPELETAYRVPRTKLEQQVAAVWRDLLQVEQIGIDDNFFDLGGHSLLATRLVFRLCAEIKADIPVLMLFEHPTIRQMAARLTAARTGTLAGTTPRLDLRAEVRLDPEIAVTGPVGEIALPSTAAHILLTGATGFIGAHLLAELAASTEAKLHCLVRADSVESGYERVRAALARFHLWSPTLTERLSIVPGDLSQLHFGLEPSAFATLAETVELIIHSGAVTNFFYPYQEQKGPNVGGTVEILRLAANARVKPVHYLSTLYIFTPSDFAGQEQVTEETMPAHPEELLLGYTQSKWVADQLLHLANQRGLPTFIYRLGRISGHSRTGACRSDDFLWQLIKSCVEVGRMPQLPVVVDMTPVDYVSRAILALADQRPAPGTVFHLLNPDPPALNTVGAWIRAYGYRLEAVPYHAWHDQLLSTAASRPESLAATVLPFLSPEEAEFQMDQRGFNATRSQQALAGVVLPPTTLEAESIERTLTYFISTGFLPAPGEKEYERSHH